MTILCDHKSLSIFTKNTSESVAATGESTLIRSIEDWLKPASLKSPQGIGDDCAILKIDPDLKTFITTDSLSYGVHFDDSVSAAQAGKKLINRNISDIAAMGGSPKQATLSLLLAPNTSSLWLADFFKGIVEAAQIFKVTIIGGDVSSLPHNQFSSVLTLTGDAAHPVTRNSAQLNDRIYVTGTLGGSILQKHYNFTPRVAEGAWLAKQGVTSMMDLTDGLAKDLPNLLSTEQAASLDLRSVPVSSEAQTLSKTSQKTPLAHAFTDGEDYELLFTLATNTNSNTFEKAWAQAFPQTRLSCIGHVKAANKNIRIEDRNTQQALEWTSGFEHFKS